MPVLDVCGDGDDGARGQADGGLALLLIPALTGSADQELSAALGGVVDVPVVAAAWLEGHVGQEDAGGRVGQRVQKGLSDKILGVGVVGHTGAEDVLLFKGFFVAAFHGKNLSFAGFLSK